MSERDSVHKEIEKLQDEVQEMRKKMSLAENRTKHSEEEVSKLNCLDLCRKQVTKPEEHDFPITS